LTKLSIVALKIQRVADNRYEAEISPPHTEATWKTDAPMEREALIARLEELDCHPRDAYDALHDADLRWSRE
jgi:hypothetical protein